MCCVYRADSGLTPVGALFTRWHRLAAGTEPRLPPACEAAPCEGGHPVLLVASQSHSAPCGRDFAPNKVRNQPQVRSAGNLGIKCVRRALHARERVSPPDEALASDAALDAWMMREVGTTHHMTGTARMGVASDPMAVTDQYGRVRGIDGLRVCDLSILPDCVRANTNATAMMVGEKVADLMRS